MEKNNFSGGFIEKIGKHIMRITFNNTRQIEIEDLVEITTVREQLFGEESYCTLIDASKDFVSFSAEARDYTANNPNINKRRIAEALLVKNFGQSIGAKMFIKLFKPKSDTKLFYKEEEAIKWLNDKYEEHHIKE